MALIALPFTFAPSTVAKSSEVNGNFTEVRDKFNTYAVQTDVAKTITVAHTFGADILFTDALFDIGKSGATRPRDGFFSRNLTVGGTTAVQALTATTASFQAVGSGGTVATFTSFNVDAVDNNLGLFQRQGGAVAAAIIYGGAVGNIRFGTTTTHALVLQTNNLPAITISTAQVATFSAGLAITAGGLTVSAGTTAVQALTATTGTFGTGLTVTAGGLTVSAGTSALQAMTATSGAFSAHVTLSRNTVSAAPVAALRGILSGGLGGGTVPLVFLDADDYCWFTSPHSTSGFKWLNAAMTNVRMSLGDAGTLTVANGVLIQASGLSVTGLSTFTGGLTVTSGLLTTVASAAGSAGLVIPHGAAPTTPNNGDMWTTTAGAFIRINGVTKTFTLT